MSKVDLKRETDKRQKNKFGRKARRDTKLQELEKQLEFAESRCGTLKQQLDYIKQLYGYGSYSNSEIPPLQVEGTGDGANVKKVEINEISKWNNQNQNFESGEGPEVIKQTASLGNLLNNNKSATKTPQEQEEEPKIKVQTRQKGHLKLLKAKKKSSRKVKKRRRADDASSSKFSNVSSQTQSQIWHDPVVEIYKNSALNVESESGLETVCNNKRLKTNELLNAGLKKQKMIAKNLGNEVIDVKEKQESLKVKSSSSINGKKNAMKEEGMQTEISTVELNQLIQEKQNELMNFLNKENSIKTDNFFIEPVKSYCQPTISSKRKQVERDIYMNLNNFNVRNIPFVAAKSTSPSHNIGINIQQVLSTIKNRQPINETVVNPGENGVPENGLLAMLSGAKRVGNKGSNDPVSDAGTATVSSDSKKVIRSNISHWKSTSDFEKEKPTNSKEKVSVENDNSDWTLKVDKLKKVLVFLHEDFTTLSYKYKRLQKKLTKRNITKTDAKGELADIERDLEKKEEEITVVIGLYKEVLNLRDDLKKLQERYNLVACGRGLIFEGLKQSNSTHTQMTSLLRKIQNFQDQLKG